MASNFTKRLDRLERLIREKPSRMARFNRKIDYPPLGMV